MRWTAKHEGVGEQRASRALLRVGAVAAVGGVVAALVQTIMDPGLPEDTPVALARVAQSKGLVFSRLLDAAVSGWSCSASWRRLRWR